LEKAVFKDFRLSILAIADSSLDVEEEAKQMTIYPDENPLKRSIIEKGFTEDTNEFAHDVSVHFIELCDACRRGDLEAVQTFDDSEEVANASRLVSNFGVDINRTDSFDASPLMLVCIYAG
jgi:hypothetical protein